METSRSGFRDWMEWRRMRALALKHEGWSQRTIARALGVSDPAVSHWLAVAERDGAEALRSHPAPGRVPRLTAEQQRLIPEFLWHGPEAYGFRGEVWTCARIALVIEEEFGVRYHKDHVGRLLRRLGWTPQMPIRRAIQRDEPAIQRWRVAVWPELRTRAWRERRVLIGILLAAGCGQDVRPRGTDAGPPRDPDARPPVGHGWDDARRKALRPGAAAVAQRTGHHRVPLALGARGWRAAVGDLGRLADPPKGGGQRVRVRDARPGLAGGLAGLRPRPEPVGRGGLASPQGRGDAQPGVSGPRGTA